MWENLLASWRQSGHKKDYHPYLLNHNAKYKRLLPPCCDFANGVRSLSDSHNGVVFVPVRLQPPLRFNIMAAPSVTGGCPSEGERPCFGSIRRRGSGLALQPDDRRDPRAARRPIVGDQQN